MKTVTTDAAMQRRAAEIGARLRAQDGVANALALVEKVVRPTTASSRVH